jgi:predicted MFS family arabinose efflux permease
MTILIIAGILGVISVTGGEIGPFMPVEQSALTQLIEKCTDEQEMVGKNVAMVFGYYNMIGYLAQALGSFFAGYFIKYSVESGGNQVDGITNLVRMYAAIGGLMFVLYFFMNRKAIEADHPEDKKILNWSGIKKENLKNILLLSFLFATDAFGGAFIVQSYLSFYYKEKYDRSFDQIGIYLFICNVISGISGILSSKLVHCIGAMATMIYTHLPSNIFLLFIAFTNNVEYSIFFLLARFCISQMDVPARQTYVTMVVSSPERSAANGITNIARSVGLSFGLVFNGFFMRMDPSDIGFSAPFLIAGGVKIAYDLTLGALFLWN